MQEKLALNIKIPRLGKNRLGVFFVRSSFKDAAGKPHVAQLSLATKDPGLAKLLGLKFCIHLAQGGTLSDFKHGLSTYIIDVKNGHFEANGEDDHRRAMEAQKLALEMQEKYLERQRLALEMLRIRLEELDVSRHRQDQSNTVGQEVAKIMSEMLPGMFDFSLTDPSSEFLHPAAVSLSDPNEMHLATQANPAMQTSHVGPPMLPKKHPPPITSSVSARPELLLKDEMNRHLQEEASTTIKPQTINEKRAVFEDFLTCFGDDAPLNSITREEVTHRWRNEEYNRKNKKDVAAQAKLDAEGKGERIQIKKLSPGRIEKRRGYLIKFFAWAIEAGSYKHANPLAQKMFTKQQIVESTDSYREFTTEDIRSLFCKAYRMEMGLTPDWYWVPLISLYCGARLGEVCDMEVASFQIIDGIKVFLVRDGKNNASKRTVPIHSKLLELGLWEYAEGLKARGCISLFPQEPQGYKSKSVGRKWGVWVSKCGITDKKKVFHSFRSTAITDMHNAGEGQAGHVAIKRSVGHATPGSAGAHGGYVRGLELQKLQSAIESVDHGGFDVSHLRLEDPTFSKFFDAHFALVSSPGYLRRQERNKKHLEAKAAREANKK